MVQVISYLLQQLHYDLHKCTQADSQSTNIDQRIAEECCYVLFHIFQPFHIGVEGVQ